jgi:hypothetical protein
VFVRALVAAAIAVAVSTQACGSNVPANKTAGAAAAVGFGVAAAGVYRAATKSCWAQCYPGQRCDHDSGMCVPLEPSPPSTASSGRVSPASATSTPPANDAECAGLCLRGERCVVRDGVADCVTASRE